jgi:hypothetical protein
MEMLIREAYKVVDCAAGRLFAKECGINYLTKFTENAIEVFVPSLKDAKALMRSKFSLLSLKCAEWNQDKVKLIPFDVLTDSQGITIPASTASSTSGDESMSNVILPTRDGRLHLVDATRRQVFDFIEEQREAGKIIMVASQVTDRCVDVQTVSRERGIFAYASQWHGYNFWELWRETIDQYFRLRQLLDSDGYIPGYVYEILRVDGSKARYKKDYFLANNFIPGEPVRISVAEPADWELIID